MPRTVRGVTPIALYAIALRAIPHDIDTLTVWTVDVYIDHGTPSLDNDREAILPACQLI